MKARILLTDMRLGIHSFCEGQFQIEAHYEPYSDQSHVPPSHWLRFGALMTEDRA